MRTFDYKTEYPKLLQPDIVQIFSGRDPIRFQKQPVQRDPVDMQQFRERGNIHLRIGKILMDQVAGPFRDWSGIALRRHRQRQDPEGRCQNFQLCLPGTVTQSQHDLRKQFFRARTGRIQARLEAQGMKQIRCIRSVK